VASVEQNEYFNQSKEKYFTEGGMRVVSLGEVTVKAAKKETDFYDSYFYPGTEDALITSEKMKQFPDQNILQILPITIACSIYTDENNHTHITIDGHQELGVLIDGMPGVSADDLRFLNLDDVESISLFKLDSMIVIRLKKWEDRKSQTPISLTKVTPLGYQKPAEFYVPKYDVDSVRLSEKADLRTTIYWNPELETDSAGTVHVKFYTADPAKNYSVVLEGLSKSGEICRFTGNLRKEN
jgi:hypothetical protein